MASFSEIAEPTASPTVQSPSRQAQGVDLSWWDRFSFGMARAATAGLLRVLSLSGLYRFGCFFGTIEWIIDFKRRRRFHTVHGEILGRATTRSERRRQTRAYFIRVRCEKLFYMIFDRLPREQAIGLFSISGREILDDAVRRNRGVYLAVSHHGPLHVLGLFLILSGYRLVGVRDRNESPLRRYIQDRIDRFCPECGRAPFLHADSFPRKIYRYFKDGFIVGSAMDVHRVRGANQKTEPVTIFGQRRAFLSGPIRIAIRCQSPVVQGFVIPEKNFRYRLEIVEMLVDPDTVEDESTAVTDAMQRYAANVERRVRAEPSMVTRI